MFEEQDSRLLTRQEMTKCIGGAPVEFGKKAEKAIELGFGAVMGSGFQSALQATQFPLWIGQAQQIGEGSAGLGPSQPILNPTQSGD